MCGGKIENDAFCVFLLGGLDCKSSGEGPISVTDNVLQIAVRGVAAALPLVIR